MKLNSPLKPQIIGDPVCPIMYRWTIFPPGFGSSSAEGKKKHVAPSWLPKLLVHHFTPQADERFFHDHPRGFITIVLRGGYDDMVPCPGCEGIGYKSGETGYAWGCRNCGGDHDTVGTGMVLGERMRPGMVRYRPAHHSHRTRVLPQGCWTVVIMGPLKREWGFWVDGKWMFWKTHKKLYGHGMRCS